MRLKFAAKTLGLQPPILVAWGVAEMVYKLFGAACVLTSGTDGTHKEGSLHYKGMAIDLRTRDLTVDQRMGVFHYLRAILEPLGYDVVVEPDHFHVEYDPKSGENFTSRVA